VDEFARLLSDARAGSRDALGQLVESCRPYLLMIANQDLDPKLRAKIGASDIVQETMLTAQQQIADFRGNGKNELLAWLRGILINDLLQTRRRYRKTDKRQVDREVSLAGGERADEPPIDFAGAQATPGTYAVASEEAALLRRAMSSLSKDDQQVLQLHNWEQLSFAEIGQRMERSPEAVRKLWSRAVLRLQQELGNG
jgi:RNA polymerase sigma-70 factor (ECF subfamily)